MKSAIHFRYGNEKMQNGNIDKKIRITHERSDANIPEFYSWTVI